MTERVAEVVKVKLLPHENADTLSVVNVGGFSVCVRTADWNDGDLAVYIRPDTLCDSTREEFRFLSPDKLGPVRVKVKRLRQVYSQGLLIPAPTGVSEGDNLYEGLDLAHYEPEMEHISTGGNFLRPPAAFSEMSKYDIDNARSSKFRRLFIDGEPVSVTNKLNGSNVSYVFTEDKMWVRSRSGFRSEEDNIFWRGLKNTPQVEEFCREHPGKVCYGEIVGNVKGFRYDVPAGQVAFRCFDMMRENLSYMDHIDWLATCNRYGIPKVPEVGIVPFDFDKLLELAEQPCPLNNPINEGICFRPVKERRDYHLGRVIAKIVSNRYLERN